MGQFESSGVSPTASAHILRAGVWATGSSGSHPEGGSVPSPGLHPPATERVTP